MTFSDLGLPNQTVGGTAYAESDLVRRKNMDNGFYTANFTAEYRKNKLLVQGGTMYSFYGGDHFATVQWAEHNQNLEPGREWVRNHAWKTDANAFVKSEYALSKQWNAYLDLQYRFVDYRLKGTDDDDMVDFTQHRRWSFFNPKGGVFCQIDPFNTWYASVAVAHREPTRADVKDARKGGANGDIKPEKMTDYEMGYTFDNHTLLLAVNLYGMVYRDQLVATGKLNDVGYALMSNVDKSYRAGIECQAGYAPYSWLRVQANATFSKNRIQDYTVYYETYDNSTDWNAVSNQVSERFHDIRLPYSPECIAALGIDLKPVKGLTLNCTGKYVSNQYYTNTQSADFKLPAYRHVNASANYDFSLLKRFRANLSLTVNNVLNAKYACNAWGWEARFANGDPRATDRGLYVAAPRNYLTKLTLIF